MRGKLCQAAKPASREEAIFFEVNGHTIRNVRKLRGTARLFLLK
jgi:hypothetical protein